MQSLRSSFVVFACLLAVHAVAQDTEQENVQVEEIAEEEVEVEFSESEEVDEDGERVFDYIIRDNGGQGSRITVDSKDGSWTIKLDGEELELQELIDKALKEHPDLKFVEADIAHGVDKLRRMRAEVVREIMKLHSDLLRTQRELVEKKKELKKQGIEIEMEDFAEDVEFGEQIADLKMLAHEMSTMVGDEASNIAVEVDRMFAPLASRDFTFFGTQEERPEMSDEDKSKFSSEPLSITFEDEALGTVLEFISEFIEMNFVVDPEIGESKFKHIALKDVTLEQALEAMTDMMPELAFVMRDYGILATTRDRASTIKAPTIPSNIPLRKEGAIFGGRAPRAQRIVIAP